MIAMLRLRSYSTICHEWIPRVQATERPMSDSIDEGITRRLARRPDGSAPASLRSAEDQVNQMNLVLPKPQIKR
jgi:hypothetical protein